MQALPDEVSLRKRKWKEDEEGLQQQQPAEIETKKGGKKKKKKNTTPNSENDSVVNKKKQKKKKAKKEKKTKKEVENGNTHGETEAFQSVQHVEVRGSQAEAASFRSRHNITLTGTGHEEPDYWPITSFAQAQEAVAQAGAGSLAASDAAMLSQQVLLACRNFTEPTPIQAQCWPILLRRRDIVGIAETGSGKTLAFMVPAVFHVRKSSTTQVTNKGKGRRRREAVASPRVLILSPTRELAMQTATIAGEVASPCNLKSVCVYGGVPKGSQAQELALGVDILIATPGRLLDLVSDAVLTLGGVDFLVLDEADRMLDLGFEEDMRKVIAQVQHDRQTLMFSATWPPAIQKLAADFFNNPVQVMIGTAKLSACRTVTQHVEVVQHFSKDRRLQELLQQIHHKKNNKVIVFVLYKKEAVRVEQMLYKLGYSVLGIHGDKQQADRSNAIQAFKTGKRPLLVATDVAARGLDIEGVEYVVNYSFPLTIEDYVHRIGRTGRAGQLGTAYTFFCDADKPRAGELINVLRESNQHVPNELLRFGTHVKRKEHALYGQHYRASSSSSSSSSAGPAKPTRIVFE
jgi:ATP-dependent RNA helicase DBP3